MAYTLFHIQYFHSFYFPTLIESTNFHIFYKMKISLNNDLFWIKLNCKNLRSSEFYSTIKQNIVAQLKTGMYIKVVFRKPNNRGFSQPWLPFFPFSYSLMQFFIVVIDFHFWTLHNSSPKSVSWIKELCFIHDTDLKFTFVLLCSLDMFCFLWFMLAKPRSFALQFRA